MEQILKSKKYMVFCEPCSYKAIIDKDESDLVEIKTSPIPGGIPELDAKTGKTKNKPQKTQSKKFKCPKCGRGIVIKELQGAHANAIKQRDAKIEAQKIEDDRKQRLQDGKPFERLNSEESEGKL
jgi:DNA-directed RNA polymerase subunit RPC12/RpoP